MKKIDIDLTTSFMIDSELFAYIDGTATSSMSGGAAKELSFRTKENIWLGLGDTFVDLENRLKIFRHFSSVPLK